MIDICLVYLSFVSEITLWQRWDHLPDPITPRYLACNVCEADYNTFLNKVLFENSTEANETSVFQRANTYNLFFPIYVIKHDCICLNFLLSSESSAQHVH